MIVDVNVDKKEKIKINRIYINGVEEAPLKKIKYAMKMRERTRLSTFKNTFMRSKKFTPEKYKEDKENILYKNFERRVGSDKPKEINKEAAGAFNCERECSGECRTLCGSNQGTCR